MKNSKGLLIDLEGVLYSDNNVIPGSVETINELRNQGLVLRFITNTTTIPRIKILKNLLNYGLKINEEEIFTPIVATKIYLEEKNIKEIFLVTSKELSIEFQNYKITNECPQAVIMGDIYKDFNWDILDRIFKLINKNNSYLISLHQNKYCIRNDEISLDLGPFVKAIEYATNKEAILMGKPNKNFFDLAIKDLKINKDNIIMIGDDIKSDIEGGFYAGLETIQVMTGKYTVTDKKNSIQPTKRIKNIKEILNII